MIISKDYAPAMGDIRALGEGDIIWLLDSAEKRKDWGRYLDALSSAITRGVDVRWLR